MKYFTIDELVRSATASRCGIDNTPDDEVVRSLNALVDNVLDPLRELWGGPLRVTSGYRCAALNAAVGGAARSQHMTGCAADVTAGSRAANKRLIAMARASSVGYDQLIDECDGSWVHVSYAAGGGRRQYLKL